jgi:lysylphosphatidylglycerol synthetase-like protein (DUF2156 family)
MSENQTSAGKGMGVTALILGILGVICSFIPCFGLFAMLYGVLAIIFGAVGLNQAKKGGGSVKLPKAGLILGIVSLAFAVLWWVMFAGAMAESASEIDAAMKTYQDAIDNL